MIPQLVGITAAVLLGAASGAGSPASISLPPHPERVGVDLASALQQRRTVRDFAPRELDLPDLSALLWAGNGVNRPDGRRTAPSAHGLQYLELYVVSSRAVYRYDAPANRLVRVREGSFKGRFADQPHVAAAPQVLVLVGDLSRLPGPPADEVRWRWIHATAGTVAQNVALMAAARGIGTGLVGVFDTGAVSEALQLTGSQAPLYLMPLGYLPSVR